MNRKSHTFTGNTSVLKDKVGRSIFKSTLMCFNKTCTQPSINCISIFFFFVCFFIHLIIKAYFCLAKSFDSIICFYYQLSAHYESTRTCSNPELLTSIPEQIVQTGFGEQIRPIHWKDPTPQKRFVHVQTSLHEKRRSSQFIIQQERDVVLVLSHARTVLVTSRRRRRKSRVAGCVLSLHLHQHTRYLPAPLSSFSPPPPPPPPLSLSPSLWVSERSPETWARRSRRHQRGDILVKRNMATIVTSTRFTDEYQLYEELGK